MKIEIDRDLCIGSGCCVAAAPRVFLIDEEKKALVVNAHAAADFDLYEAARLCPTVAVLLYDEATGRRLFP